MNQKQLKKLIEKSYDENDQHLYITTAEDWWWNPKNRCCFDIILTDGTGKKFGNYLFTIANYSFFNNVNFRADWSYFRKLNGRDIIRTSNLVEVSHLPLYMNQQFTLKKFENLTKQDIYNCTNYLVKKILKCWLIFNIEVVIPKKDNQNEKA